MKLHIELDDSMRAMFAALPSDHRRMLFKQRMDSLVAQATVEVQERLIDYLEDLQDTPGLEK